MKACLTLFLLFLGCSVAAAARADCTSSMMKQAAPDGTMVYVTAKPYPGAGRQATIERLWRVALERGFIVVKPPHDSGRGVGGARVSMDVEPKAPRMYSMSMTASNDEYVTVSLRASPRSGVTADKARNEMCWMLAQLQPGNSSGTASSMPSSGATPAGPITDPSRTVLADHPEPLVNVLRPGEDFDPDVAQEALKPGNSTIKITACGWYQASKVYPTAVLLVPATPYMRELMKIMDEAQPGRDSVDGVDSAMAIRMEARANPRAPGHFQFSRMKPGTYFLFAALNGSATVAYEEQVGRVANSYDSANVYRQKYYTTFADDVLKELVDIRQDGEEVSVNMRPPTRLLSPRKIGNSPLRSCL